jgi:hypothetical protein
MSSFKETQDRMLALAKAKPLPTLCEALLILDRKGTLTQAERLTLATLMDAICAKSPAADAAFERWAQCPGVPEQTAVEAIIAAATGKAA